MKISNNVNSNAIFVGHIQSLQASRLNYWLKILLNQDFSKVPAKLRELVKSAEISIESLANCLIFEVYNVYSWRPVISFHSFS